MSEVALKPDPQSFPPGTVVKVRAASSTGGRREGEPPGAILSEPTVAASGTLTVTGLTDGTAYAGYASVGGKDRYLTFTAGSSFSSGGATGPAGPEGPAGPKGADGAAGAAGAQAPAGSVAKYVNYVAAAEAMPGEGAFAVLATPDRLTFTLAADSLVHLFFGAMVSGPTATTPALRLFIDGAAAKKENNSEIVGEHTATEYGKVTLVSTTASGGTVLTDSGGAGGTGETLPYGGGSTFFLKAGEHTVEVRYKGNTNNKAKERRMIAVVY